MKTLSDDETIFDKHYKYTMKTLIFLILFLSLFFPASKGLAQKIFDVHIHGSNDIVSQLKELKEAGVYKAALSSSWNLQNSYRAHRQIGLLYGLMFPCPNGSVPYSLQPCFENKKEWPPLAWVEQQIKDRKIDYFGEILSQYYGISSADSLLFPYYALAEKYNLPVGIHTGGAGPNHGSPNFKMELGDPHLMEPLFLKFPKLKVWIMHSGDQYFKEAIAIMTIHNQVYADISVISNPDIVPTAQFIMIMKSFLEAGLIDRLMFGTDNGNIKKVITRIERLNFLSKEQKDNIYYQNAERFFRK
ncbi:amidohydrolase family protein [Pedobacter nyackensis]|uniref:Amidohydrolase n=1 Tax=Pedobacter nyackensis TaxID=475255 RepID=A0A1W2AQ74_9SPHI|nr:amidohydrolase family protein [Pedobacter nyackensis]SMC62690.1 Amidohydrolase [Pedobacter nyackensis]